MGVIHPCILFRLTFCLLFPTLSVFSQQIPDRTFDAKVANPAYTDKHPRVLFDEAHNNFHTSDGRYRPFAQLITNDGYNVAPNKEKFSRESLKHFNILVISNALGPANQLADPAFGEDECDIVRDWVRAGGALLLIADHYPMGSAAQNLSMRFGVDMSNGFTDDPNNYYDDRTDLLFTRENRLLGDHSITRGRDKSERINRVASFTGQSLKGPNDSVALLKLSDTAFDLLPPDNKPVSAAGRVQGLAMKFGKGRVVVMGEAAMLTAQLFGPNQVRFGGLNTKDIDNRQLSLNIMHWLSGLLN
jgi:hypothetical protein